ncbi:MAG TPA: bifunctional phosphopantothenoylcysteine decarboxylase/phosphopantothenate--cysteine ligase CoaBC [Longimicrobiales bacterium]|nr:bifunctional phosphopantothenoylcysteine decarboxylase/phosphopantothenate--cysteine ligase CoaBC [Longimicrobiales bacterium]
MLLGVTGGIAAYKAVQLARDLTLLGARVDVVMTGAAAHFVGALSFEGVTGRPVHQGILEPGHALDHIRLAREADLVCVAPATADFLARAAAGRSNDLLGAILLATRAPVLVCPAMNDRMWAHPQTQANAGHVRAALGYEVVGPGIGPLAYDEGEGAGRMVEPDVVLQHIGRALAAPGPLRDRQVVVTAGPTREAVDPVRFVSNHSSGRMGFALAAAAWRRGADVTLVAGPAEVPPPPGPKLVSVDSAADMEEAVGAAVAHADVLIMAAAVADFRPAGPASQKIKKQDAPGSIPLEPTADILAGARAAMPEGAILVGFALETQDAHANATKKLKAKDLDLVVLNDATRPGAGFGVETNEVVMLDRDGGEEALPVLPKDEVAECILDRVERLLGARR